MTLVPDDVAALATALAESGLAEMHLTGRDTDIHLVRSSSGEIARVTAVASADEITAIGVGIFLTCHPLRQTPLAARGQFVRAGQTVALLRTGLLLRPVTAPVAGYLSAPLAEPGALVGYGTALFSLQPGQPEAQR
jgi:acetyl-CoA carboxylase biotin carboxyl carrier protein